RRSQVHAKVARIHFPLATEPEQTHIREHPQQESLGSGLQGEALFSWVPVQRLNDSQRDEKVRQGCDRVPTCTPCRQRNPTSLQSGSMVGSARADDARL